MLDKIHLPKHLIHLPHDLKKKQAIWFMFEKISNQTLRSENFLINVPIKLKNLHSIEENLYE